MYPLALEKQYKRFFAGEFAKIAKPFMQEVIKRLKTEIKADSDMSIRADSLTDILVFIEQLKEEYGDRIDKEVLRGKIKKNYAMIDAWSRDKSNEILGKHYARLNTPQLPSVTGRPAPKGQSGELWMTTVKLRNNLNENFIDKVVKTNVSLIDQAYKSHFNDISQIVKDGILAGKGSKNIAEELRDKTGINISKTEFWARDQASKFFGETTRTRLQGAGIPGYVWRCVGDSRTRDTHLALEGTYHDWNNPPAIDGRALHPGMDFNCRCWQEPATPEMAEKEYEGPVDNNYFENVRPGTEPAQWGKSGSITERMIVDISDPSLKQKVGNMIDELDKVLNIDPKLIKKALTVTSRGDLLKGAVGVYSAKSTVIMVDPRAPYPETTYLHEYMHYLDNNLLKNKDARDKLLDVIKKSSVYKDMQKLINKGVKPKFKQHLEYLMKDKELLARAFEQYIDYKSKNEQLGKSMLEKKNKNFGYLFDENDIKRINIFFDALLKKSRLLK
ncbi:MAG: minor capsid protein [Leptospirales bacterium]|nr:minor capsid protein [Leptospirales bacterium]